jgi:hypothetical protein
MTVEEVTLALFTVCNSVRIFGYLPQLVCSSRDVSGGSSTSVTTWAVFFAANASTAAYALVHTRDPLMALMFSLNALCCVLITIVTLCKRRLRVGSSDRMAGRTQHRTPSERARPRPIHGDGNTKHLRQPERSSIDTDTADAIRQRQHIRMQPGAMLAPGALPD